MATMQKLQELTGYTRDGLNKIFQGRARFNLPPVEPGQARRFTRDHFVELAFFTAVLRIVHDYDDASMVARRWMVLRRAGKMPPFWAVNPRYGFFDRRGMLLDRGFSSPDMSVHSLQTYVNEDDEEAGYPDDSKPRRRLGFSSASSIVIFDLADLVRRADELFAEGNA